MPFEIPFAPESAPRKENVPFETPFATESTSRKENVPFDTPFATESTHRKEYVPFETPFATESTSRKENVPFVTPFATESLCATHGPFPPLPQGVGGTDHEWHMDSQWQRGSQMAHYHLLLDTLFVKIGWELAKLSMK